jgi:hypothetical protein
MQLDYARTIMAAGGPGKPPQEPSGEGTEREPAGEAPAAEGSASEGVEDEETGPG